MKKILPTLLLAFILARLTSIWVGPEATQGELRIAARVTQNIIHNCRPYTDAELIKIPTHMRKKDLCESSAYPYTLQVLVDNIKIMEKTLHPQSSRGDHPLYFEAKAFLAKQNHQATLVLSPPAGVNLPTYQFAESVPIQSGRITFVTLNEDTDKFDLIP